MAPIRFHSITNFCRLKYSAKQWNLTRTGQTVLLNKISLALKGPNRYGKTEKTATFQVVWLNFLKIASLGATE